MNQKLFLLAALLTALLISPTLGFAENHAKHQGKNKMYGDEMKAHSCMGGCPMHLKDTEVKVENTQDGAVITITSKNAETIKAIQEKSQKCLACNKEEAAAGDEMVTCPVMGSTLPKSKAVATREYKGKTYYLCCQSCVKAWDKNPEKYATQ